MTPVEINQLAHARAKFSLPGHRHFEESFALWGFSSRRAGQTLVTGCMFEEGEERAQIDQILRTFQDADMHANWFFGPSSRPDGLPKILRRERRFMGPSYLPAMIADLSGSVLASRTGVTARRIEDWDAVLEEGYPASEWYPKAAKSDAAVMARELSQIKGAHYFSAYCDGFLAASCLLFVHEGIGGIYDVVTKSEFRDRGAATAAISAAHGLAHDLGCRVAILQSHKKAAGLYKKLGYRDIGNYVSMYYSRVRMTADREARLREP